MEQVTQSGAPVLALERVGKQFGGITALDAVDLELAAGQVVALVGENGAGKSTAVKIMTGIHRPDRGRIRVHGTPVELTGARDAWRCGIAAVHQETAMFDELSIAENMFMGHLVTRRGRVDWTALRRRAREILASLESDLAPDTPLGALSVARKHLVEIARALSHDARVLIMDEPTAALSTREVEELFATVRRLRASGKAILFISHKLDEVFAISDRYTVLRDGCRVGDGAIRDVDPGALVRLMVGRPITQIFPKTDVAIGPPVLEVRELGNDTEFDAISFALRKSEVLGFYGLVGAGRTELMEAIFGLSPIARGSIAIDGAPAVVGHGARAAWSPRRAIDRGLVLIPEDRQAHGAMLARSVRDNLALPSLRTLARGPFVDTAAEADLARRTVDRLAIRCAGLDQKVGELSGGNQQKVVIGKWFATRPRIIILDEPTKGIDVGSKASVHALVGELVAEGVSVILVSSELPELLGIADRIAVMHRGRIARVIARAEFDAGAIIAAATGVGGSTGHDGQGEPCAPA